MDHITNRVKVLDLIGIRRQPLFIGRRIMIDLKFVGWWKSLNTEDPRGFIKRRILSRSCHELAVGFSPVGEMGYILCGIYGCYSGDKPWSHVDVSIWQEIFSCYTLIVGFRGLKEMIDGPISRHSSIRWERETASGYSLQLSKLRRFFSGAIEADMIEYFAPDGSGVRRA